MANWYHCSVRTLGKSGGRSAVQFSAYMAGEKGYNERTGEHYDHTSKEEVICSDMMFSADVPEALTEREKFWNALEQHETSANARFSRTFELALDNEGTPEQWRRQVEEFSKSLLDDGYSAAQYAIHAKDGNIHAHIMTPCRQMEHGEWAKAKEIKGYVCRNGENEKVFRTVKDIPEGYERVPLLDKNGVQKMDNRNRLQWKRQNIENDTLNTRQKLVDQRERWADIVNRDLAPDKQVSHLSYKARGIDKTPQKHQGYKVSKLEEKGIKTDIGDFNRNVKKANAYKQVDWAKVDRDIAKNQALLVELKAEYEAEMEKARQLKPKALTMPSPTQLPQEQAKTTSDELADKQYQTFMAMMVSIMQHITRTAKKYAQALNKQIKNRWLNGYRPNSKQAHIKRLNGEIKRSRDVLMEKVDNAYKAHQLAYEDMRAIKGAVYGLDHHGGLKGAHVKLAAIDEISDKFQLCTNKAEFKAVTSQIKDICAESQHVIDKARPTRQKIAEKVLDKGIFSSLDSKIADASKIHESRLASVPKKIIEKTDERTR